MFRLVGYASSSVVETIGTFSFSTVSNCGNTVFNDELVHSTATSGLVALIAFLASSMTGTLSRLLKPATSPRSRPAFAGSMSTAPTILNPFRAATCRTMPTPMGPRPKCNTRMGPDVEAIRTLS